MKRCSNISGWTDYPFAQLGDIECVEAPVRHVQIIGYDGNKYATIVVNNIETTVKCGYLYSQPGRLGDVKAINRRKLERMIQSISNT